MKFGVYKITNLQDSKCYIGSTASQGFEKRWRDHRKFLRANKHHSRYFQNAWNKYGATAFIFEILLYCDPENCLIYEQIALDHYKPEYNMSPTAGSAFGIKRSATTKRKLRDVNLGKHKGERNISAKIDESTALSILDDMKSRMRSPAISKKYNLSRTQTKSIMSGKSWSHISVCDEINQLRQVNQTKPNLGSRQGGAKLREQQIPQIRTLIQEEISLKEIATKFGVSVSCIKNIKYNTRWRHV